MRIANIMPSFSFKIILCTLVAISSFHGELVVLGQDFSFPSGRLTEDSLTSVENGDVDSTGTLVLDASVDGEAQAFYSSPIALFDTASASVHSFSTFFTFASNATSGNGTVAFVVVPDVEQKGGLAEARKTFTVEFNASCGVGAGVYNGTWDGQHGYGSGRGWGGRGRGGHGGFRGGGLGGFQVLEYANNTQISVQTVSGYGPGWTGQYNTSGSPYSFCYQQPPSDVTNPIFQYQVVLEYNASTDTVWVGSPSCGAAIARTSQFNAFDLSSIITKPVYVGFIVTGGGVFNLSQWNFTSNATTSSVTSLALSASTDVTGGGSSAVDGRGRSNGKLGKGWVAAFAVLGAVIGIGAVAAVCCLCAARRRRRRVNASGGPKFVAKSVQSGIIPESAVVFDAKKPPAKVVLVEKDTTPLNTYPNSASHGSDGAPNWLLQPVAPR